VNQNFQIVKWAVLRICSISKTAFLLSLISLVTLCLLQDARATLIFDNLNNTTDGDFGAGSADVSGGTPLVDASRWAVGFTIGGTDQSGSWTFTIQADNPFTSPVVLTLVNNIAVQNNPSEVATFSLSSVTPVSSLPGGGSGYSATGSGTLTAGSTYWLVASAGSSTSDFYSWVERRTTATTGVPSYTGSASFFGVQNDNAGWGSFGNLYPGLSVDVTPVPEPAHSGVIAALFLVACSVTQMVRRNRAASKLSTNS
jgi:hypothetical protein